MKKGYKRILIFELVLLILLLLNSFVSNILEGYKLILFLFICVFIFYKLFGYEKDNFRYRKAVIMNTVIFLIMFFSLYYLLGVIVGLARTDNYFTGVGFKDFLIPITLSIVLQEFLRYMIVVKCGDNKKLLILTILIFILIGMSNSLYGLDFAKKKNVFMFVALSFLPSISTSIVNTYITKRAGFRPVMVYSLVMGLYRYVLPIVPNSNEYITSLILFVVPIVYGVRIRKFYKNMSDEYKSRDYNKKVSKLIIIPIAFMLMIIYFTSGYFNYYAVAIASGSMEPRISTGDIVVINRKNKNSKDLKVGDIIAFNYNGSLVVHRIEKIINSYGDFYYYTKGDANKNSDNYPITPEMVIGTVKVNIPLVGIPTVWLNGK